MTPYRAKCGSCGAIALYHTTPRPGDAPTPCGSGKARPRVYTWSRALTVPDHLPLIALCRYCLGLKRKALERAS
jgi:hypothetical protein